VVQQGMSGDRRQARRYHCRINPLEPDLLMPREGGYLFRIYVELDKLKDDRVSGRNLTIDRLVAKGASQQCNSISMVFDGKPRNCGAR
jgi:hypothetical protein